MTQQEKKVFVEILINFTEMNKHLNLFLEEKNVEQMEAHVKKMLEYRQSTALAIMRMSAVQIISSVKNII